MRKKASISIYYTCARFRKSIGVLLLHIWIDIMLCISTMSNEHIHTECSSQVRKSHVSFDKVPTVCGNYRIVDNPKIALIIA